jgi:hypothetical protein
MDSAGFKTFCLACVIVDDVDQGGGAWSLSPSLQQTHLVRRASASLANPLIKPVAVEVKAIPNSCENGSRVPCTEILAQDPRENSASAHSTLETAKT